MTQHEGRVALVTGAARNIGRATALELAGRGFDVVVATRSDEESARAVAEEARALGVTSRVVLADLADAEQVQHLIDEVGQVDVLVNNAALRPHRPFLEVTPEEWRRVFAIIVDAPYLLCRAMLPGMQERGWGRIVNLTGVRATQGAAGRASSAAAKHALVGLTRSLANEFGPHGITANVVCPGTILTESNASRLGSRPLVGALERFGSPEDVASVIGFIASDAGSYITGQSLGANGGELMF